MTRQRLDDRSLDQLFRSARTQAAWTDAPVHDATLTELHTLASFGPTAWNCQPMRLAFVRSRAAKQRLAPALMPGNVGKTLAAPVTAIVAIDSRFFERLPDVCPLPGVRELLENNPPLASATALRNGSLQGGYLMLAARSLGLDCGPMSGFDAARVDAEFFPDGRWKSNFLCNLGYADAARVYPRQPRLAFDVACSVL
jgi:3-hydroxypropanoate dehydrogenase